MSQKFTLNNSNTKYFLQIKYILLNKFSAQIWHVIPKSRKFSLFYFLLCGFTGRLINHKKKNLLKISFRKYNAY